METQVLGLSVDSTDCLRAWAESLGGITYPLLSDFYPHGQVAQRYGVLRAEGFSERAIFIIDKKGIIRYVDVHDIDEQPDNEVLFDYTLDVLRLEGVAPFILTRDLHASEFLNEETGFKTSYEETFVAQGLKIHYLAFRF